MPESIGWGKGVEISNYTAATFFFKHVFEEETSGLKCPWVDWWKYMFSKVNLCLIYVTWLQGISLTYQGTIPDTQSPRLSSLVCFLSATAVPKTEEERQTEEKDKGFKSASQSGVQLLLHILCRESQSQNIFSSADRCPQCVSAVREKKKATSWC